MTSLAVTGYASVDYAFSLAGQIEGDRTTLVDSRDANNWPRIGGCPAYVATAAARHGQSAFPISWIGTDNHGQLYLDSLAAEDVAADGVAKLDRRSPMAVLAYQADGSCACLFDPGFSGEEELTARQQDIVRRASHLCVSVGPPQAMEPILARRSHGVRLYWICKNDEHCFTPAIRETLCKHADVIFCSRSERDLIGDIPNSTVVLETHGGDGVLVHFDGQSETLETQQVAVSDTTGAGDTFAGGFIAAEMSGVIDPLQAARTGIASALRLLEQRAPEEGR